MKLKRACYKNNKKRIKRFLYLLCCIWHVISIPMFSKLMLLFKPPVGNYRTGAWWLIGRFVVFRSKGRGLESRTNRL